MTAKTKRTAKDRAADRAARRIQILEAVLPHVDFDGWTDAALEAGAKDIGMDAAHAHLLFPDGIVDLVAAFSAWADMKMLQALEKHDLAAMGVTDTVALAVRLRLEALAPYREAVRRGLGVLALPGNCALAAQLTAETVDAVWYAAGDRSHDFNWYTKRGTLGAVYSATVLYWLADASEGFSDTWDFLHRRLTDAVAVIMWRKKTTARIKDALSAGRVPGPLGFFDRLREAARARDRA